MEETPKLTLITKEQFNNASAKEVVSRETKAPVATEATPSIKEKVEPVVAEVKQEEAKSETTVGENGEVKTKRRTAKEIAKPFTLEKNKAPEEAGEIPEEYKVKFSAYEKKINELESKVKSYDEDSGYQLLVEARKLGKDAIDLFDQVKGEDVSKMTDLQLLELDLRKAGVKDEGDVDGDEPSLQDELDKFKALPKTARDREINEIRKKYNDSKANVANEFLNKLKTKNQEMESVSNADRQAQIAAAQKTKTELDAIADAYVGKEHYAVTGTPQLAESIKNFDLGDYLLNKDGSLNTERLFDLKHYCLTNDLRIENLENQFFAEGLESYKQEVDVTGKSAKSAIVRSPQIQASTSNEPAKLRAVSAGHESVRV